MDNETLYGLNSLIVEFTPFAKLAHLCSGDGGATPGGGVGDAASGATSGGGDGAAGGGGDAGGGDTSTTDTGADAGSTSDAEQDFLNDTSGDEATQADDAALVQADDAATEEIDPVTGLPKPKLATPQLTPEQQEQARIEEDTLKDFYAQTPALKEFLKANPTARGQFFKAAQINQIYSSVDDARMAADYATELASFDRLYSSPKPEDTKSFVDSMWSNSLQDPDKPFHPQANPSRGNFERVASAMTEIGFKGVLGNIEKAAQTVGLTPQQGQRALEYVATMLGINVKGLNAVRGGGATGATGATGQPNPQEEALTAREQALQARENAIATQAQEAFEAGVTKSVTDHVAGEIDKALKPAAAVFAKQPQFVQDSIRKTIAERTVNAIKNDRPFQVRFETEELRGDRSPAHADRLLSLMRSRVNEELPRQANSVMREAGLSIVKANTDRLAAKQTAAGRREIPASASPGRITRPGQTSQPNRGNGAARPNAGNTGKSWGEHADTVLDDFVNGA